MNLEKSKSILNFNNENFFKKEINDFEINLIRQNNKLKIKNKFLKLKKTIRLSNINIKNKSLNLKRRKGNLVTIKNNNLMLIEYKNEIINNLIYKKWKDKINLKKNNSTLNNNINLKFLNNHNKTFSINKILIKKKLQEHDRAVKFSNIEKRSLIKNVLKIDIKYNKYNITYNKIYKELIIKLEQYNTLKKQKIDLNVNKQKTIKNKTFSEANLKKYIKDEYINNIILNKIKKNSYTNILPESKNTYEQFLENINLLKEVNEEYNKKIEIIKAKQNDIKKEIIILRSNLMDNLNFILDNNDLITKFGIFYYLKKTFKTGINISNFNYLKNKKFSLNIDFNFILNYCYILHWGNDKKKIWNSEFIRIIKAIRKKKILYKDINDIFNLYFGNTIDKVYLKEFNQFKKEYRK